MELTHELVETLRRKLEDELAFVSNDGDKVLAAFDRAVLATVLSNGEVKVGQASKGPAAGSAAARKRGLKAAATRAKRKLEKEGETNASQSSGS